MLPNGVAHLSPTLAKRGCAKSLFLPNGRRGPRRSRSISVASEGEGGQAVPPREGVSPRRGGDGVGRVLSI
jgi:hypothetical protein